MLPKKTTRTKQALAKLKVYLGAPAEYAGKPAEKAGRKLSCETITLAELCKQLGWNQK